MRNIIHILKLVIPIALLLYIFRSQVRFHDVIQVMSNCNKKDFFIALSLFIATKFQIALRLNLIASHYFRPGFRDILKDIFIANFFNTILPVGTGELYRIKGLADESKMITRSAALIILDRMFGFTAILTTGFAAVCFGSNKIEIANKGIIIFLTLTLMTLFLLIGSIIKKKKPGNRFIREGQALFTFIHDYPFNAACLFAYSIMIILTLIYSIYFIGKGLGLTLVIWDYFCLYPVVLIASLIPLSIGGLGIREFANIAVFGAIGVPKDQCVSLGLMQYLMMLIVASAGLMLLIVSRNNKKT